MLSGAALSKFWDLVSVPVLLHTTKLDDDV